jgi:hypothetical protein
VKRRRFAYDDMSWTLIGHSAHWDISGKERLPVVAPDMGEAKFRGLVRAGIPNRATTSQLPIEGAAIPYRVTK